jgi:hypothetical protein
LKIFQIENPKILASQSNARRAVRFISSIEKPASCLVTKIREVASCGGLYAMAVINCVPINVNDCGRPGQTCNKPGPDRIDHIRKNDWHALGALLQCGDTLTGGGPGHVGC